MGLPKSVEILHLMIFIAFFTRRPPPPLSSAFCRLQDPALHPEPQQRACLNDAWPLLVPVFPGRVPARGQLGAPFCTLEYSWLGQSLLSCEFGEADSQAGCDLPAARGTKQVACSSQQLTFLFLLADLENSSVRSGFSLTLSHSSSCHDAGTLAP